MPLEATLFCLDNSDWMRNGDYNPTRLTAQNEAVQRLASANLRDNSESMTGFLTMAASKVEVHLSPCKNMGKMLNSLKALQPSGVTDVITALQIAQLTLKNRQNKSQRQRIILFIGSPLNCTADELTKAGKFLKKNNVAVDIVLFGSEATAGDNSEKLEALLTAVNNNDNSHLVTVPPGPHRLVDMLLSSPIAIGGTRTQPEAIGTSGAATFDELDSLMETDPELAMALRMSLADSASDVPAPAAAPVSSSSSSSAAVPATPARPSAAMVDEDEEDEDLAAAIALSLQMEQEDAAAANTTETATPAAVNTVEATPAPTVASTPAAPVKDNKMTDSAPSGVEATPAAPAARDLTSSMNEAGDDDELLQDLLQQVAAGELDAADVDDILKSLRQE